jgi:predicted MFS family arabinose efflux permease
MAALSALVAAYFASQFYRNFVAVIAPELAEGLKASLPELGVLSSVFFFCSALAQIPMGVALDRFGAGRTVGLALFAGALGALGFSMARNLTEAIIAQALLGVSCAPLLMGLMHFIGQRYPKDRFVTIASAANAIGLFGNLVSGAPLGWLANTFGWRAPLIGAAVLTAAVGAFVLVQVPDPSNDESHKETASETARNVLLVLSLPQLRPLIPLCLVSTGIGLTFRSLWGGPYLDRIFGLDVVARGTVLSIVGLGVLIAAIVGAILGTRLLPRSLTLSWSTGAVLSLALLAIFPGESVWISGALLTATAFFGSIHTYLMAEGRRFFPEHLAGRGLGVLNFFVFLGIGMINVSVGWIVEYGGGGGASIEGFRLAFAALAALLSATLLVYALGGGHTRAAVRR